MPTHTRGNGPAVVVQNRMALTGGAGDPACPVCGESVLLKKAVRVGDMLLHLRCVKRLQDPPACRVCGKPIVPGEKMVRVREMLLHFECVKRLQQAQRD